MVFLEFHWWDTSHVDQICRHFLYLRENIESDNELFLAELEQRGVLAGAELQPVRQESVTQKANDKLLTLIMRKSAEQFNHFLTSLQLTGQGYIVELLNGQGILFE